MTAAVERNQIVGAAIQNIKIIVGSGEANRQSLAKVLAVLNQLAGRTELWSAADFASPESPKMPIRALRSTST
jgi:hypothetical protein